MISEAYKVYTRYDESYEPDWETASKHIECARGVVVVEIMGTPEKIGSIYLPERVKFTDQDDDAPVVGFEPSVAAVLQADPNPVLGPGSKVLVLDGDGLCLTGCKFGPYEAKNEVRVFGRVVPNDSPDLYVEDMPWEESILAVLDVCGKKIKAMVGTRILLRRDEAEDRSEGGILLPEGAQTGPSFGTILATGNRVTGYKEEHRVCYHPEGAIDFMDDPLLRIIDQEAVLFRVL